MSVSRAAVIGLPWARCASSLMRSALPCPSVSAQAMPAILAIPVAPALSAFRRESLDDSRASESARGSLELSDTVKLSFRHCKSNDLSSPHTVAHRVSDGYADT